MAYLMIVDDDEDFANAAATVLRSAGHEVDVKLDVAGAAESLKRRPPDLAMVDVIFPEDISAGFSLVHRMREEDEGLKDVPVLMLTAVNQIFPFEFGSGDVGADSLPVSGFLEKPIDLDVLCDTVSELLQTLPSA